MADIKSVLVTGSTGQLGQELCKQLERINGLVLWKVSHSESNEGFIHVDFEKEWNISQLPVKCDAIVHLAQSKKFRNFPETALEVFKVNTFSTVKLLDYAKKAGVKKFIYASSGGVYGYGDKPFTEGDPINTNMELGNYINSKICSELLVRDYQKFFGVNSLRFFFMYGEKQEKTMLIPRLLDNIVKGQAIAITGKNGLKINPIYVSDAASAVVRSIFNDMSGVYNIAGNEVMSLRDICDRIGEITKQPAIYTQVDSQSNNLLGDNHKMIAELFKPEITLKEGIAKIWAAYEN